SRTVRCLVPSSTSTAIAPWRPCRGCARKASMPFQRIPATSPVPAQLRGGVVAIGNFDGVHRGHQAVLGRALEEARRLGLPSLVLTFDPHPRKVFHPDRPLFVLTPPAMRPASWRRSALMRSWNGPSPEISLRSRPK